VISFVFQIQLVKCILGDSFVDRNLITGFSFLFFLFTHYTFFILLWIVSKLSQEHRTAGDAQINWPFPYEPDSCLIKDAFKTPGISLLTE